jgi:hypothetical protein
VFCARLQDTGILDPKKLELGLLSMVDSQLRQLKESSQAIVLIEEWMMARMSEAEEWHTYQEIFNILQTMANARHNDFKWKNAQGLSRHLSTLKPRLEQDFGAEFKEFSVDEKIQTKIRFRVQM